MDLSKCILSTLLLIGISYALPQKTNLDDLIGDIFKNDDHNQQSEKYKLCGKDRVCVPKFLCKNDEIITDGTGIIDKRAGGPTYVTNGKNNFDISREDNQISSENSRSSQYIEDTECGNLEICCNIPKQSNLTTLPSVHFGCDYLKPNVLGYRTTVDDTARFGEFAWMVAILRKIPDPAAETVTIYECGGALIAPMVILTAAHCVENHIAQTLIVRAGKRDVQINNEILQHQNRQVRKIILHEKFNKSTQFNDIALMILESPYENVRPICLTPENTHFDFYRCHVTGWDKVSCRIAGKQQIVLKKFNLPVMLRNQCQTSMRITRMEKYFSLHESFICAGGELGKVPCNRDGGSLLVCPIADKDGNFNHAGIVAWSIGCGKESIPGEYVNVAYLHTWINEKLSKSKIDFS